jgi:2-(3-amino-3-carboxypropyl)histidine synthase
MLNYDLDLEQAKAQIREKNAKTVCIQLPEGLKPEAGRISKELEKTGATILIWMGSCYGACDIPTQIQSLHIDLLLQWGHSKW